MEIKTEEWCDDTVVSCELAKTILCKLTAQGVQLRFFTFGIIELQLDNTVASWDIITVRVGLVDTERTFRTKKVNRKVRITSWSYITVVGS